MRVGAADWRKKLTYPEDPRPEAEFITLWDETIDPTWLPCLAKAGGATKQQIVFAVCAVARLCLPLIPEGENRPRVAIETAEKWTRGEATAEQVSRAGDAAFYSAAYAAAYAANYSVFSASYYTVAAAYALQAGIESQLICATIRKHLVFERPPRPKGLTVWQRLVKVGDE